MAVTSMANSSIKDFNKYNKMSASTEPLLSFLLIGGGAGGGGGGGGAGGYIAAWNGELSGGNSTGPSPLPLVSGVSYPVSIGGGGALGSVTGGQASSGTASTFGLFSAVGGGFGATDSVASSGGGVNGGNGGSGGGAAVWDEASFPTGGLGTALQGFAGGNAGSGAGGYSSGAGGGAGGAGQNAGGTTDGGTGGLGGAGLASTITGSSVTRASGGGAYVNAANDAGGANTGEGGGGKATTGAGNGFAGGSGVLIIRIPSNFSLTVGAGLTSSSVTVGTDTVYTFTAGSDTITVD
jgi:hypothetical protein